MGKRTLLLAGIAATLVAAALWHGPLGAGARLGARLEARAQQLVVDWDIPEVSAHIATSPLSREIVMAGPANDFQRRELKRLGAMLPGVRKVVFADEPKGMALPLALEAALLALLGFTTGLLIAYLGELRRRSHQWDRF